MAAKDVIAQAALDTAQALQNKVARLRDGYLASVAHAACLKAEYDQASNAPKRLATFQGKIGLD
jgi:hypothetical protein